MSKHVNIANDEVTVPWYAVHKDGQICGFFGPFRFLSNFFMLDDAGVCLDEIYYPSVEHAYQAAKYPIDQREQFLEGITPGKAKYLGGIAKINERKWNKGKVALMSALCRQKFTNIWKLKTMLLMTEDAHLEERNDWGDTFWGTDVNGVGENNLGKLLMDIRGDLLHKREMF